MHHSLQRLVAGLFSTEYCRRRAVQRGEIRNAGDFLLCGAALPKHRPVYVLPTVAKATWQQIELSVGGVVVIVRCNRKIERGNAEADAEADLSLNGATLAQTLIQCCVFTMQNEAYPLYFSIPIGL